MYATYRWIIDIILFLPRVYSFRLLCVCMCVHTRFSCLLFVKRFFPNISSIYLATSFVFYYRKFIFFHSTAECIRDRIWREKERKEGIVWVWERRRQKLINSNKIEWHMRHPYKFKIISNSSQNSTFIQRIHILSSFHVHSLLPLTAHQINTIACSCQNTFSFVLINGQIN